MRISPVTLIAMLLAPSIARADRIAVVPLESPERPASIVAADRLSSDLTARGYRVIAAADALARLSAGDTAAGPDWGAEMLQEIGAARAALARLDRSLSVATEHRVATDIGRRGGGTAGNEVLVEWYLLKRQLAITASDAAGAAFWLDTAVAAGPDIELDPLRHPEEERDVFSRRRHRLRERAPATLLVATTPSAADVWIDGVRRCPSPCSIALVPGRHLGLVSSPAHAPAAFTANLDAGATESRRLGLSAAYAAATPGAIAAMLSNPSRRAEGASALEPLARFIDVTQVVALFPEGDKVRILVAPPAAGRSRIGPLAAPDALSFAVMDQLVPTDTSAPAAPASAAWYARPTPWIIGAAIIVGVVAGALVYDASRTPSTGTLTVGSR